MLDIADESLSMTAERWLAVFESAVSDSDWPGVEALFHAESHWRDVLALTWDIETFSGAARILAALKSHAGRARASGFKIDRARTPPRRVTRAGTEAIEAIFSFETATGCGDGVLRLIPDPGDGGKLKAWTLLTALEELRGFEERIGDSRPSGESYSRDFRGPNWLDLRNHPPPMRTEAPRCWWWAGDMPGFRSPHV